MQRKPYRRRWIRHTRKQFGRNDQSSAGAIKYFPVSIQDSRIVIHRQNVGSPIDLRRGHFRFTPSTTVSNITLSQNVTNISLVTFRLNASKHLIYHMIIVDADTLHVVAVKGSHTPLQGALGHMTGPAKSACCGPGDPIAKLLSYRHTGFSRDVPRCSSGLSWGLVAHSPSAGPVRYKPGLSPAGLLHESTLSCRSVVHRFLPHTAADHRAGKCGVKHIIFSHS